MIKEEVIVEREYVDVGMIARMFLAGARNLEAKKEWINELNVFPVPDGDTGTNMTMTILSAAREVAALEDPRMKDLARAIASGSLRGARGNSGVILSQLLRGFTKGIEEHDRITVPILADAFGKAVDTAYKAVMKPKEGTILTVARGGAEKAQQLWEDGVMDLESFFSQVIEHMEYVLNQTPEMLPVLAQAGVVDSGGQGLVEVLKGAQDAFLGKETDYAPILAQAGAAETKRPVAREADIKFGYCTEFIIMPDKPVQKAKEDALKTYLESIGDSIVVVADDEVIKVHVHTNDPGLAIQKALSYGALSNMKIDNMRLEHQEKLFRTQEGKGDSQSQAAQSSAVRSEAAAQQPVTPVQPAKKKAVGFIAVCAGEGLSRIFRELGVDYIIEGGQTMNPSTEDVLNAIEKVNADTIFLLPNNKNIVLAANQAKALAKEKEIIVIPTSTVPQGITAVITYVPELSPEENESAILEEISHVRTGQVTYAVRDTSVGGREIHQGDYMGISDTGIVAVNADMKRTALETIDALITEDVELLSIYYGNEISQENAEELKQKAEERHPEVDIELQDGGQPVYYYMISAE